MNRRPIPTYVPETIPVQEIPNIIYRALSGLAFSHLFRDQRTLLIPGLGTLSLALISNLLLCAMHNVRCLDMNRSARGVTSFDSNNGRSEL